MLPDASLPLDASLAPAQVYIVLAITVATFGWLLKPETLGELSGSQVGAGALLVVYQCLHVALYTSIHGVLPALNTVMHGGAVSLHASRAFPTALAGPLTGVATGGDTATG